MASKTVQNGAYSIDWVPIGAPGRVFTGTAEDVARRIPSNIRPIWDAFAQPNSAVRNLTITLHEAVPGTLADLAVPCATFILQRVGK